MILEDRKAADAVLRLVEHIRKTQGGNGKIEILIEDKRPTCVRIVRVEKSELITKY
jgi:hypothetical protein